MARNGTGTYALPSGNPVTTGTQITATWGNTTLADIAAEITNSVAVDGQSTITGPLKCAAGSVSAPSFTFSAETNTGFYKSATNVVSLAIAGSQKYIFGATSVTLAGTAVTAEGLAFAGGTASAANITTLGAQPYDALLAALAAQTTAANKVQAYSGADTPVLLTTGTSSGNIPLVGTASATTTVAGLVTKSTTAENAAGTGTGVVASADLPTAVAAIGLGGSSQSWKDVKTTPGRVLGTTYTNTTGKPIMVNIETVNTGTSQALLTVGSTVVRGTSPGTSTPGFTMIVSAIVPPGATYTASSTNQTLSYWNELTA